VFALPLPSLEASLPICDIEHDMGVVVKGVFDQGSKANGKLFPIVSEFIQVYHFSANSSNGRPRKSLLILNMVLS
jgi:hypothetical protein